MSLTAPEDGIRKGSRVFGVRGRPKNWSSDLRAMKLHFSVSCLFLPHVRVVFPTTEWRRDQMLENVSGTRRENSLVLSSQHARLSLCPLPSPPQKHTTLRHISHHFAQERFCFHSFVVSPSWVKTAAEIHTKNNNQISSLLAILTKRIHPRCNRDNPDQRYMLRATPWGRKPGPSPQEE